MPFSCKGKASPHRASLSIRHAPSTTSRSSSCATSTSRVSRSRTGSINRTSATRSTLKFGVDFKVVDLGLRLDDAQALHLESEPVLLRPEEIISKRPLLVEQGALPEEIDFLLSGRRIELNAMTSAEFVDFIERKLTRQRSRQDHPCRGLARRRLQGARAPSHRGPGRRESVG